MNTYFSNIKIAIQTSLKGLQLTFKHAFAARKSVTNFDIASPSYFNDSDTGIITLSYPYTKLPVPQTGRYKLHNEIDDCIVCDKCAKICPVDCIEIEPIKSTEDIGYTSDGSLKKIYAATFNIDMAKCCFCGLCTSVCPTECLTMKPEYDYIETDVAKFNIPFSNMTAEQIAEKKKLWEEKQNAKAAASTPKETPAQSNEPTNSESPKPKPVFKPVFKKPSA
ncbi:MAG: 4Fe-4S binding protein [Cytophagales bacterium]